MPTTNHDVKAAHTRGAHQCIYISGAVKPSAANSLLLSVETLEIKLEALRQALLTYRQEQPEATFVFVVANEERDFFGLANQQGGILLETTREVFYRLSSTFHLTTLRYTEGGTQLLGLKITDLERVDPATNLPLAELMGTAPRKKKCRGRESS